jgi:hypothetical protein
MSYPDTPGFKSRGTSSLAGRQISPHAEALRDRVAAFLKANYPAGFTADEVTDRLAVSFLSVRPRMSAQCWRAKEGVS